MKRNIDIQKEIKVHETIVETIMKRKLRLFGYICRMDDRRLVKHTLFVTVNGKSRRRRPCKE